MRTAADGRSRHDDAIVALGAALRSTCARRVLQRCASAVEVGGRASASPSSASSISAPARTTRLRGQAQPAEDRQREGTRVPSDQCDVGVHRSTSIEEEPVHQGNAGRQGPLRHRLRHSPQAAALGAAALIGCGSGDAPARSTSTTTTTTTTKAVVPRPQLYAAPVVVKIGTTFEVRVRFKRALPLSKTTVSVRSSRSVPARRITIRSR